MIWLLFVVSLLLSVFLVWVVRSTSVKLGRVVQPREDRWHRRPTPTLGGVGIYLAFILSLFIYYLINEPADWRRWGLLAGSTIVFFIGLYDDIKKISPPAKLVGEILAAAVVVFLGYKTNFFTPRIPNALIAQIPNILLTFFWLVGITNAINLLDNMDGLAAGIALINVGFLSYFFWLYGDQALFVVSLALAGSIAGFLIFNFPPASIFMGDSGSLFLGFTLAVLAIARQPRASNVFAIMGVPTVLFLLPILDTSLVTITRILRGQSPVQGGRDHTSHRLIAFGLSERRALIVLYAVALLSGFAAIIIDRAGYWLSLLLVPILVVTLALLVAYLGRLKVVVSSASVRDGTFSRLIVELTYRRRLLEIMLDFILIAIAYYVAFLFSFGFIMDDAKMELYLRSLPIALAGSYVSYFFFGVYRGVWRYVGLDDLFRYAKASLGAVALVAVTTLLLDTKNVYTLTIFMFFGIFIFLSLTASRSSFKILDLISSRQTRPEEERILILGAGDAGEMAVRWILMNPDFGYRPVGFLDEDPFNTGRQIHGVAVLGGLDQLEGILEQNKIDGVVVTSGSKIPEELVEKVIAICHAHGRWVRSLRLEFELME
jgi:UDP-GlcNAc:undecaprenyl-phosphate/decaprenyl-phosphate GlcNAc-1-phosphate transferase